MIGFVAEKASLSLQEKLSSLQSESPCPWPIRPILPSNFTDACAKLLALSTFRSSAEAPRTSRVYAPEVAPARFPAGKKMLKISSAVDIG